MKKVGKLFGIIALIAVIGLVMTACPPSPRKPVLVTGVSLDKETLSFTIGGTVSNTLTATVAPANAANKNVTWSVEPAGVVTLGSTTGTPITVTAVNTITTTTIATITVSTVDGAHEATCTVTVNPAGGPQPVPVQSVAISPKPTSIDSEATTTITANITPTDATNKNVTWSVAPADVVTLSKTSATSGEQITVTALATTTSKTATITVTSAGNQNATDSFTITVNPVIVEPIPVEEITITTKPTNILVGATQQLTATIEPDDADNQDVTWESSDPTVATISGTGLTVTLNAISVGTATITVTSDEDPEISDSFTITVDPILLQSLTIRPHTLTLGVENTGTLEVDFHPANATNKDVTWSIVSSDPAGVVTLGTPATANPITITAGSTAGTAKIRVTSDQSDVIFDEIDVEVIVIEEGYGLVQLTVNHPTITDLGITINVLAPNDSEISKTGAESLTYTIQDMDANYTYIWYVDGVEKAEGEASLTVNAGDYSVGNHSVLLTIKDQQGVTWSSTPFSFTVDW